MDTNKINDLAKILRQNQLTKLDLTEGGYPYCSGSRRQTGGSGNACGFCGKYSGSDCCRSAFCGKSRSTRRRGAEIPAGGYGLSCATGRGRAFVQVGDKVKKGDVLCIVESMKMFNNIEAELEGTIAAVCVDNGQIVEFGQPLVRILPEKEEN